MVSICQHQLETPPRVPPNISETFILQLNYTCLHTNTTMCVCYIYITCSCQGNPTKLHILVIPTAHQCLPPYLPPIAKWCGNNPSIHIEYVHSLYVRYVDVCVYTHISFLFCLNAMAYEIKQIFFCWLVFDFFFFCKILIFCVRRTCRELFVNIYNWMFVCVWNFCM